METFNLSEIKAGTVVRKSRSCCLKNKMAELNKKTRKGLPCMGLVFNSVDIEESVISFLTAVSLYSADIKVSPGQNKKINLNTSVITHYDFFFNIFSHVSVNQQYLFLH